MSRRTQQTWWLSRTGFTLIELMAVVLVIVILVAIAVPMVGYVQKRASIQYARAQLAAMETALESYRSDVGSYPVTPAFHFSNNGAAEATNNWYLYRALTGQCTGCKKRYLSFPPSQIVTSTVAMYIPFIRDPWGTPYNYYNSPAAPYSVGSDGNVYGGQHNSASYDLFSLGQDQSTFLTGVNWSSGFDFSKTNSPRDDITNWTR